MKNGLLLFVALNLILSSCQNSDWINDNNSIRPICTVSEIVYNAEDFEELNEIENYNFWSEMNQSNYEVAVHLNDGELILSEPKFKESFFKLDDGKLEIINNGEFGGALNFIPKDYNSDTITICKAPINFVFNLKGKTYFVVGIAHGQDSGGAIFELNRKGNKFAYKEVVRLDSAPETIAIYKNKILIGGHRMFTIVENFKKENIIEEALWHSLYPNSIAVKNENEVYVGMRDGYSKLSLNSKEVKYFKYKGK